ncbi:hypothetical protein Tco_1523775 [Tanacetum coccineum]
MSNSGLEEFQQPEFKGYGPKASKSVYVDTSNEVKKTPDTPLVEELVSEKEKQTIFSTKIEFVKQQDKTARKPGTCPISQTSRNLMEDMLPLGEEPNEGKLLVKGTLKTGNLEFEDVYFVKELQFNLFSVSQMCDKKTIVLFIDIRCFVLSPDFKLADESQVLLKVPRKNNMYSVDMKNIVPKESLTCLVSKATLDESMLWHRRLGHWYVFNYTYLLPLKTS